MPRRTIILATLLILLSGAVVAIAAISENTGVALSASVSLTGPDGVCMMVTNASPTGKQVYVPGSTAAEWQSFVANPPAGVTLAACGWQSGQTCSGPILLGMTWVGTKAECQAVCDHFSSTCCTWEHYSSGGYDWPTCILHDGSGTQSTGNANIEGAYVSSPGAAGTCQAWPSPRTGGNFGNQDTMNEEGKWDMLVSYGYSGQPSNALAQCKRTCELGHAKTCSYISSGNVGCWWNYSGSYYSTTGFPHTMILCTP